MRPFGLRAEVVVMLAEGTKETALLKSWDVKALKNLLKHR